MQPNAENPVLLSGLSVCKRAKKSRRKKRRRRHEARKKEVFYIFNIAWRKKKSNRKNGAKRPCGGGRNVIQQRQKHHTAPQQAEERRKNEKNRLYRLLSGRVARQQLSAHDCGGVERQHGGHRRVRADRFAHRRQNHGNLVPGDEHPAL